MGSKIKEEHCNQKEKPVQRFSCDDKKNCTYKEPKASIIAKQILKRGWTNKGRLDHLGLIGNDEKWWFEFVVVVAVYHKSNEKLL